MEIYVITSGEYSEYSIEAVYVDKVAAEKHVELANKNNRFIEARIEEYEAGEVSPKLYYSARLTSGGMSGQVSAMLSGPSVHAVKPETKITLDRYHLTSGVAYGLTPEKAVKNLWDAYAKAKAEHEGL